MSRELSGVIACLQEIEMALVQLKKTMLPHSQKEFSELAALVRDFFPSPGKVPAEKIQNFLRQTSQAGARWMQEPLIVDGIPTTLAGLCDELTEVLEDLS